MCAGSVLRIVIVASLVQLKSATGMEAELKPEDYCLLRCYTYMHGTVERHANESGQDVIVECYRFSGVLSRLEFHASMVTPPKLEALTYWNNLNPFRSMLLADSGRAISALLHKDELNSLTNVSVAGTGDSKRIAAIRIIDVGRAESCLLPIEYRVMNIQSRALLHSWRTCAPRPDMSFSGFVEHGDTLCYFVCLKPSGEAVPVQRLGRGGKVIDVSERQAVGVTASPNGESIILLGSAEPPTMECWAPSLDRVLWPKPVVVHGLDLGTSWLTLRWSVDSKLFVIWANAVSGQGSVIRVHNSKNGHEVFEATLPFSIAESEGACICKCEELDESLRLLGLSKE